MVAKNPFDELYNQISQLLNFVKTHSLEEMEDEKIPADIDKRLEKIHSKLESFDRIGKDIIMLSGVSDEEIKMRLAGTSKEIPDEGKELIQRGHEIKQEAEKVNEKLEKTLQYLSSGQRSYTAIPDTPKERVLDDKQYTKKRRSKFKRFGSDNNWKPL